MPATPPTSSLNMQNWFSTTLSAPCGSTDTTLSLTNTPTPTEGYLIIDPNNTSTREVIHYTSVGAGSVTLPGTGDRGVDGTTATSHAQGTAVVMNYTTSHFTALQSGNALSAGAVKSSNLSNPYKFSVYRNGAWTTGSPSVVNFDTKVFDTSSNVDIVTNKGRFTAPVAGFYQFNGAASMTLSDTSIIQVLLYKNGSLANAGLAIGNGGGPTSVTGQVSALLQLAQNDYVEVYAYGAGATGLTGATLTYFQGFLVSAT